MHDDAPSAVPRELLSEDQRDALQEIANIGMGAAGAKLAVLLDRFVALSIPRVVLVERDQIRTQVELMLGANRRFTAFRQSFRSDIAGEAMTFFDDDGTEELCEAIYGQSHAQANANAGAPSEWLFEVANLLTGACLSGLLEQLGRLPTFSVPRAIGMSLYAEDIVDLPKLDLDRALLLDINMRIEHSGFKVHLLVLMADGSIERLGAALDDFLATLLG
ncbi:chemotaxis protein CheC [Caballeronia sp. M23-90]